MGHLIALLYRRRNIGQRNYRPCMDLFMSWHCALDARSSLDSARESACGRIAMHDASRCLALMQECEPQLLSRSAASSAAVVCDPKQHFIAFTHVQASRMYTIRHGKRRVITCARTECGW